MDSSDSTGKVFFGEMFLRVKLPSGAGWLTAPLSRLPASILVRSLVFAVGFSRLFATKVLLINFPRCSQSRESNSSELESRPKISAAPVRSPLPNTVDEDLLACSLDRVLLLDDFVDGVDDVRGEPKSSPPTKSSRRCRSLFIFSRAK